MQNVRAVLVAVGVLAATACASTRFNSTWSAPDAAPLNYKGQKVVALIVSPEEGTRRGTEEFLARELTTRGAQGVPAHTLISTEDVKARDRDKAKAAFEKAGAAGVVAMRVISSEKELSSTPGGWYAGPAYGSFWGGGGYYGYGWGAVYEPSYLRTDTVVSVETLVFDLKQDKLVWAGRSQTTNPTKANAFIKELVNAAAQEMKKAGLFQ
jgi:hypothetical protein